MNREHSKDEAGMSEASTAGLPHVCARPSQDGIEARLRNDLKHAANAVIASCESCGAPLFDGDNICSDPNGVYGCWHAMTDVPDTRGRPCYAYRVNKGCKGTLLQRQEMDR